MTRRGRAEAFIPSASFDEREIVAGARMPTDAGIVQADGMMRSAAAVGSAMLAERVRAFGGAARAGLRLVDEVEAWLERTKTPPSRFSKAVRPRDPHFVSRRLRGGRQVAAADAARARAIMNSFPDGLPPPGASRHGKGAADAVSADAGAPASLAEQVKAEAEEAGARRRQAGSTGTVKRVLGAVSPAVAAEHAARIATGDLAAAEPHELIAFVRRQWPDQFARVKALAAELGLMPGEALFRVIAAGLECLECDEEETSGGRLAEHAE